MPSPPNLNGRKITKESAPHFRELANQARAAKRQALEEAKSLAESLLKHDPNAQAFAVRLERQSAMIDGLILREMAKAGTEPNNRGVKLEQLLKAQGVIIAQLGKVREMQPKPGERARARMLEPLKAMAERDPAVVTAALRPMLEPKPAQPSPAPALARPGGEHEPAPAPAHEPLPNPPSDSDPASLFG